MVLGWLQNASDFSLQAMTWRCMDGSLSSLPESFRVRPSSSKPLTPPQADCQFPTHYPHPRTVSLGAKQRIAKCPPAYNLPSPELARWVHDSICLR
eukprot:2620516-Amphidinium_carterae.1